MFKRFQTVLLLAVLSVSVVSFSGCFALLLGAAAGAGATAWANGDLEANLDVNVERAHSAAVKGLKRLELPVTTDLKDKHNAKVRSKYSDGKDVTVDIQAVTERTCRIKIRVGVFGDQARSEAIMTSIKRYL